MELSPCQFVIYDSNEDGLVTLEEFNNVYDDYLANKLMEDLDEDGKLNGVFTLNCHDQSPELRPSSHWKLIKSKIVLYSSVSCGPKRQI